MLSNFVSGNYVVQMFERLSINMVNHVKHQPHLLSNMAREKRRSQGLFSSQPHFAKPNFGNCGSHKNVAGILEATKCGKSWQKIYSMTSGSYG
jgi:ribosomal protein L44E